MRTLKLNIVVFALFACQAWIHAQWDMPYSQFWLAKGYYNPALGGDSENIQLSGGYKYLWSGIEDAPRQFYLSATTPVLFFGMNHQVGVVASNVSLGSERNSLLGGQYALGRQMGKGRFTIGIQAGVRELNFDESSYALQLDSTKGNRQRIVANPVDKRTFDLNAGISWTTDRLFAGVAAMHVNRPGFYYMDKSGTAEGLSADSTFSKIPLAYNLMAGYNIQLFHTLFELQPMLFIQTDWTWSATRAALQITYDKKYSVGASSSGNEGYTLFARWRFQEMELGYAYDAHRSGMGKESNGSHEITLRYRFPMDLSGRTPQPHKSIRLL